MRAIASLVLCSSLIVACTAAPQRSPAPPPSDSPPAGQSASPQPVPTPTPQAADLVWGKAVRTSGGLGALSQPLFTGTAHGYALVPSGEGSGLWYSTDARHWTVADSPFKPGNDMITIRGLAAGDAGLVAVGQDISDTADAGAVVLTSPDGQHWQRISDPSFKSAAMDFVGIGRQGIVVFGYASGIASVWTSPDGHNWQQATNESALEVARGSS